MIHMLREFANGLKQEGLMVPTTSLHLAVQALDYVDLLNPAEFHAAMQACLVQRPSDLETFEKVFYRYFFLRQPLIYAAETQLFTAQLKEFGEELRREGDPVTHILADYLEGDVRGLLDELYIQGVDPEKATPIESPEPHPKAKRRDNKEFERLRNRVKVLIELAEDFSARSLHLSRAKREKLSDHLRSKLMEALELIDKQKKPKGRRELMPWEKKRTLSTINFNALTHKEVERVKEEVEVLARKLHDSLSRQRKKSRAGHLDIKKTLRLAIPFGGTPFHLKWKRPAKKKGKIVALCDISSSVSYAAQFMVLLMYRLQNRFSKIRTFVFIRQAYEITSYFETYPMETALVKAVRDHKIGMGQPSNYGSSFVSFRKQFESAITPDTTLLVLGDGQNNFNDPMVEDFAALTRRASRTLWLNPEEERFWYSASNSTRHYAPHCTQVHEVATLDQLSEFVKSLVL